VCVFIQLIQGEYIMVASVSKDTNSGTAAESGAPLTEKTILAAHEAINHLSARLAKAESSMRHMASDSTESFSEKQEEIKVKVRGSLETAREFTRENPVMAAGIAFAAGAVLASLLRR
jgi:ElaB/YqjD/DUF883 family membrane-anchored ribosome-binding protein